MGTGMQLVDAIREGRSDPPAGITTLGLDRTHHWLTTVEPGHVELTWDVEPAYFNLDGAVICSWIVALADQALFFAGQTLCAEGEGTRMASLGLDCIENIGEGALSIVAHVDERVGDRLHATCEMRTADQRLAARVTAVIDVTR